MTEKVIDVTRKLTVVLEKYESLEYTATIRNIPYDTSPYAISDKLDEIFQPELARAELATSKTPDDTCVYEWNRIAREGI